MRTVKTILNKTTLDVDFCEPSPYNYGLFFQRRFSSMEFKCPTCHDPFDGRAPYVHCCSITYRRLSPEMYIPLTTIEASFDRKGLQLSDTTDFKFV